MLLKKITGSKNHPDFDQNPQQSFAALQSHLGECRLCLEAGYKIYPRAIFSGPLDAKVMIIGQAPGITEKEAGRPFNAGSGTRLFGWLSEAGIAEDWYRQTQYMTSVTKCYPGRGASGSGDRVPSKAEQLLCRPYLETELALVNPELIIPVGRLAINLFFASKLRLAEIIGTEKVINETSIVPLPHPSGASRWHQIEANQNRIHEAITRIKIHFQTLFPKMDQSSKGNKI